MTSASGVIAQPTVPTFSVEVSVRQADGDKLRDRQDAYEVIGDKLQHLVDDGFQISIDDFFGWAVCEELVEAEGRRTRAEVAHRIPALKQFVMRDLPGNGGSLRLTGEPGRGVVEYVGVGLGLSLVDELLSLDTSYFRRIPPRPGGHWMDFEGCRIASTGSAFVQLEAKGRRDGKNVTAAWDKIDEKKRDFHAGKAARPQVDAPLPLGTPTFLIGTVAEIPLRRDGTTRVVIGDPPIPSFGGDPERARLLQRLRFYQRALSVFQPRSALLAALSERIGSIERPTEDWRKFDEQRLTNWRMEKWELASNIAHTVWMRVNDQIHGRAILSIKSRSSRGQSDLLDEGEVEATFFFGLHRDVLLALARQDFKVIANRRFNKRYVETEFEGTAHLLVQLPSGLIISSVINDLRGATS